jgi:Transglycosylase
VRATTLRRANEGSRASGWQRAANALAWLLAAALALAVALAAVAWHTLAAREGEWSHPLRIDLAGRTIEHAASVATLLRVATHPLAARVIEGRSLATQHGRWRLVAAEGGGIVARCAPCALQLAALGPLPLSVERAELHLHALGADRYRGVLSLGAEPRALRLDWRGLFERPSGRFAFDARLPATPLADAVHVLGRDLPERDRVQVAGTIALTLATKWPGGAWKVKPVIEGFEVAGLGTERLAETQRPAACRVDASGELPALTGWLPRAVLAAEDQRFHEHPGYDLAAMVDAWQHNQRPGAALAGASTITQQVAKLTVAGDERSPARKLRELIYAVEMERTLGKARILQLYLALAPWGEGVCGAERAARVHLGQRDASTLGPLAAAWLASLLPAPDALLRAERRAGQVDAARVTRVIEGMRLRAERREKALDTLPFWSPPSVAGSPSP